MVFFVCYSDILLVEYFFFNALFSSSPREWGQRTGEGREGGVELRGLRHIHACMVAEVKYEVRTLILIKRGTFLR